MPEHVQTSSFEIGDLVSAIPGTAGVMGQLITNPFMGAGITHAATLGVVLDWHVDTTRQWVRYNIQWLHPKKVITKGVLGGFLNKVLARK